MYFALIVLTNGREYRGDATTATSALMNAISAAPSATTFADIERIKVTGPANSQDQFTNV